MGNNIMIVFSVALGLSAIYQIIKPRRLSWQEQRILDWEIRNKVVPTYCFDGQGRLKMPSNVTPRPSKEVINILLSKDGFNVTMTLKVDEAIEKYFKRNATSGSHVETETSTKWKNTDGRGLKFYTKNEKLGNKVAGYSIMDNFGNGLMEGSKINVALLRAVGVSEGITIQTDDLLSYTEMEEYVKLLATWTKKFYEEELRPSEVKGSVTFEV